MLSLSRKDVPMLSLDSVDDSSFTVGDQAAWAAVFRDEYRAARSAGKPLDGRVHLAVNVMNRMFGGQAPSVLDFKVQELTTMSPEYDALVILVDQDLADDAVEIW